MSERKRYAVSEKNRTIAIVLACFGFVGLGGLQRIYVGKNKTGAIYLMSLGLFFFGTLYDIYMLYMENFKDADGFPLRSDTLDYEIHRVNTSPKYQLIATVLGLFSC